MQNNKNIFKRIFSILIAIIFAISPMLLTGCIDFSKIYSNTPHYDYPEEEVINPSGGGSGGSGGTSGSGSSSNNNNTNQNSQDDEDDFDEDSILKVPNKYIESMLVTYKPTITTDSVENVFEQVSIYAISELYKKFGYSIEEVADDMITTSNNAQTSEDSTVYTSKQILLKNLFGDSIVVSNSEEGKILDFDDNFKFDFADYTDGDNWQIEFEDALQPVDTTDKSSEEIANETAQKLATRQRIQKNILISYINDVKIRRKFALGLVIISANKNLTELQTKFDYISGTSDSSILTNSHNVFSSYINDITSMKFNSAQKTQLVSFIKDYVLGTTVVDNAFASTLANNISDLLTKVTCYANYDNDHTFVGGEYEGMSGYQNYQSLIIMPKQITEITEMDLYFSTPKQSGVKLHLYLRYYDATNGWANFYNSNILLNPDTTLYDLGSVDIAYYVNDDDDETIDYNFDYDDDDYDEGPTIYSSLHKNHGIKLKDILSSASFEGKLPTFEQISDLGMNSPDVAVGDFGNGKYFEIYEILGKQIVIFSQSNIDAKQSYFELVFVTENDDDTFKVVINIEDADLGEPSEGEDDDDYDFNDDDDDDVDDND